MSISMHLIFRLPRWRKPERDSYAQVLLLNGCKMLPKNQSQHSSRFTRSHQKKFNPVLLLPELLPTMKPSIVCQKVFRFKTRLMETTGRQVWLLDFKNPYNNEFVVANQLPSLKTETTNDLTLFFCQWNSIGSV